MRINHLFISITLIIIIGSLMLFFGAGQILDTKLFYTADTAYQLLSSFSQERLEIYRIHEYLDLLLIGAYTYFFLISFKRWRFIAVIPGCFDLIETLTILFNLNTISNFSQMGWLGYISLCKWIFGTLVFIVLLYQVYLRKQIYS